MPLTINLDQACCGSEIVPQLHAELDPAYRKGHSILEIPDSWPKYVAGHRTARKRVLRAERGGYVCLSFNRADHEADIYAIHTSLEARQGRRMHDWYRERQSFSPLPVYPCPRHAVRTTGVFAGPVLVAYLLWYLAGDFAHVSTTLGHGDRLDDGVMYLLFFEAIRRAQKAGVRWFGYNLHSSGTDGLRFFKERLGFQPEDVEWVQ